MVVVVGAARSPAEEVVGEPQQDHVGGQPGRGAAGRAAGVPPVSDVCVCVLLSLICCFDFQFGQKSIHELLAVPAAAAQHGARARGVRPPGRGCFRAVARTRVHALAPRGSSYQGRPPELRGAREETEEREQVK